MSVLKIARAKWSVAMTTATAPEANTATLLDPTPFSSGPVARATRVGTGFSELSDDTLICVVTHLSFLASAEIEIYAEDSPSGGGQRSLWKGLTTNVETLISDTDVGVALTRDPASLAPGGSTPRRNGRLMVKATGGGNLDDVTKLFVMATGVLVPASAHGFLSDDAYSDFLTTNPIPAGGGG